MEIPIIIAIGLSLMGWVSEKVVTVVSGKTAEDFYNTEKSGR